MTNAELFLSALKVRIRIPFVYKRGQANTNGVDTHESFEFLENLLLAKIKVGLLDRKSFERCLSLELDQLVTQDPFEKLDCYSPAY